MLTLKQLAMTTTKMHVLLCCTCIEEAGVLYQKGVLFQRVAKHSLHNLVFTRTHKNKTSVARHSVEVDFIIKIDSLCYKAVDYVCYVQCQESCNMHDSASFTTKECCTLEFVLHE